jgi:hypothetical protein
MKPRRYHLRFLTETSNRAEARWRQSGKPSLAFLQGWRHLNDIEQLASPTAADLAHHFDVQEGLSTMRGPSGDACAVLLAEVAKRVFDYPPRQYERPFAASRGLCLLARKLLDGADVKSVGTNVWAAFQAAETDNLSVAVLTALERVATALRPEGPWRPRNPTPFSISDVIEKRRIFALADAMRDNPSLRAEFAAKATAEADAIALQNKVNRSKVHWGTAWSEFVDRARHFRKLDRDEQNHLLAIKRKAKRRGLQPRKGRACKPEKPGDDR